MCCFFKLNFLDIEANNKNRNPNIDGQFLKKKSSLKR